MHEFETVLRRYMESKDISENTLLSWINEASVKASTQSDQPNKNHKTYSMQDLRRLMRNPGGKREEPELDRGFDPRFLPLITDVLDLYGHAGAKLAFAYHFNRDLPDPPEEEEDSVSDDDEGDASIATSAAAYLMAETVALAVSALVVFRAFLPGESIFFLSSSGPLLLLFLLA